jgi:hypothetical protein
MLRVLLSPSVPCEEKGVTFESMIRALPGHTHGTKRKKGQWINGKRGERKVIGYRPGAKGQLIKYCADATLFVL